MNPAISLILKQGLAPEHAFGVVSCADELDQRYKQLLVQVHPDKNPDHRKEADEASAVLSVLLEEAKKRLSAGVYGKPDAKITKTEVKIGKVVYEVTGKIAKGAVSNVYSAVDADGKEYILKVGVDPKYNSLLEHDANVGSELRNSATKELRSFFPKIAATTKINGRVAILHEKAIRRYITAEDLLSKFPSGVPEVHVAWIFNRMLTLLTEAYKLGYIHGAISLRHILVCPDDHTVKLLDWKYATKIGTKVSTIDSTCKEDLPPELPVTKLSDPATDIYMLAKCMLRLLDGTSGKQNSTVSAQIRSFFNGCLVGKAYRIADPSKLFFIFKDVIHTYLKWPKQFHILKI